MSVLRKLAGQTAIYGLSSMAACLLLALAALCHSCRSEEPKSVLVASREAQLGHVTLTLFANGTFLLHNADIRGDGERYEGHYELKGDTLQFTHAGPIPFAGCEQAVLSNDFVVFNGCFSSLRIMENNLDPHTSEAP